MSAPARGAAVPVAPPAPGLTPLLVLRRLAVPAATASRRVLADRGGLVTSVVFFLLVSVVLSALWRAAAGPSGTVVGYTAAELTWYAFAAEAAVCTIDLRLIERIGEDISSGSVAVEMLRPLPVVAVRLAVESGRALGRLVALVVVGSGAAWLLAGPPPDALHGLLALVSLALGVVVNVAAQHVVASAAFRLRDVRATWFLYQKTVFILGGMLLPLEVLPGALRTLALWCPFMAMAYAPARLATGQGTALLLLVQAGWLVVLVAAAAFVFARGQRRLEVVGG
ncbi:ABC-2 family transporter protein [Kineosporia sp. A_224]|uniref:ABC transporter permease n=1 Tax=Kineosporia sp. A_224 TaxID=1962180 RepID=UPI0013042E0F|nr:ABC-2 family transporter protein [Kineosporia sp. A_224]